METHRLSPVVLVVAGDVAQRDVTTIHSTLNESLSAASQIVDVIPLPSASQCNTWLGRTPAEYGSRNTTLALSVAAYRRATEASPDQSRPIGAAVVVDLELETWAVAIHSCECSEYYEFSQRRPVENTIRAIEASRAICAAADRIPGIQREAYSAATASAIAYAPRPLADVWHQRRPAIWSEQGGPWQFQPNRRPAGVLSGAFHPLHGGHVKLREAAEQFLGGAVHYELPIANADKPSLDYLSIDERYRQFADSTLAVTSAPTFVEKIRFFEGVTFVVGVDTAERIVDPRFYGDAPTEMERALSQIASAGCRFLVAGRRTTAGFQTIRDVALPAEFVGLFAELPESEFRMDVSSTQSRRHGLR